MNKLGRISLFFTILLLAGMLRFYCLTSNPPSLDWDEASIGYNAYSLLITGKDEYGVVLPVSFQSFGDFKPPLYIYLTVGPVWLFGLNEFSTRSSSAVVGLLAVAATYFLVKSLSVAKISREKLALVASLFLAISPWHLQFSRVAFEANLGLFFTILGFGFLLKSLKKAWLQPVAVSLLMASLYSYHSCRFVVPLFLLGFFWYFRSEIFKKIPSLVVSCMVGIILMIPFIIIVLSGTQLTARFGAVSAFQANDQLVDAERFRLDDKKSGDFLGQLFHDRRIIYIQSYLGGYLDHLNFSFLFLKGDEYLRHNASRMGLLYYWDFIFIILGIFILLLFGEKETKFFIFWWFIVAPSASALTKGTPHAVRSLLYLPTFQILSAVALVWFCKQLVYSKRLYCAVAVILLLALNMLYYLDVYYIHTSIELSQAWQYGYKQAVAWVAEHEDEVSKVIFTNKYDQPYIYFLFYKRVDPIWYQKVWNGAPPSQDRRIFDKYEFRRVNWEEVRDMHGVLIVGSAGEPPEIPPEVAVDKEINFLDESVAFRILKR